MELGALWGITHESQNVSEVINLKTDLRSTGMGRSDLWF